MSDPAPSESAPSLEPAPTLDSAPSGLAGLRPGDRVAVLAPAGPCTAERLERAVALLRDWDLRPVVFDSAVAVHPRADYLAGPDDLRAQDFQNAWCDEAIAAIFCTRGGYGSIRILDLLDAEEMARAPGKPVFGSSDVTALHEWLRERLGAASWFSPMVTTGSLLDDEAARDSLRRAVFDGSAGQWFTAPTAEVMVAGVAEGTVIGGNLSLLAMTLAARGRPEVRNHGSIALLEDITEKAYRVDGYLQSLLRAGWFDGVAGIALGSWFECSPPEEIRAVCRELLAPLDVPMVWELGFGHGNAAPTIPLGVIGRLHAEPAGRVGLEIPGSPHRAGVGTPGRSALAADVAVAAVRR